MAREPKIGSRLIDPVGKTAWIVVSVAAVDGRLHVVLDAAGQAIGPDRDRQMTDEWLLTGATQKAIGAKWGVSQSVVYQATQRAIKAGNYDQDAHQRMLDQKLERDIAETRADYAKHRAHPPYVDADPWWTEAKEEQAIAAMPTWPSYVTDFRRKS